MEQVLLKADQAAVVLGLGRSQVYRMAASGTIPTVRFGRTIRIPAEALLRWVEERTESGKASGGDAAEPSARAGQRLESHT